MKISIPFFFFGVCLAVQLSGQIEDTVTWNLDLDNVVVTAQYAPTHSNNALHRVKVIKALELKQQGFNNLSEVLTNELNLRVSADLQLGSGLSIGGLDGQNVQIMIDGIPVIGRLNGNVDLSQINLFNVERIEIVQGAMSAQYGSNASGGVVNIIKKKSQLGKVKIDFQNQYETVGNLNNSLTAGVNLGKFFASLNLNHFQSELAPADSLRVFKPTVRLDGTTVDTKAFPWNPKLQYGTEAVARYRFSDSTSLSYNFRYFEEEVTNRGRIIRPQFRPYANDEFYSTFRADHSLNLETYLNEKFYLNSTTAYNDFDRLKKTLRLDVEPDTTSLLPGGQDTSNFTAFLHRSTLSSLSKGHFNGFLGVELLHETGSGNRLRDTASNDINTAMISNYAGWASLRYAPSDRLKLITTLRYGYNSKYDHPLIPAFNLSWQPSKKQSLKFGYARGFRAPSLKELHFNFVDALHDIIGNPDLKAEQSRNITFDYHLKQELNRGDFFNLNVNLFSNQIRDRIVMTEYEFLRFNFQNLDEFQTAGMNLSGDFSFGKRAKLKTGFGFSQVNLNTVQEIEEEDESGQTFEFQNELRYLIPKSKIDFVLTHRYIGRQIRFTENVDGTIAVGYLGDYHLLNASLSRNFWKNRIFLSAGAKNILNTQSVPVTGQGGGLHNVDGSSQLINWGRNYFFRVNLVLN